MACSAVTFKIYHCVGAVANKSVDRERGVHSPAMGGPAMTDTPRAIASNPKALVSLSIPIISQRMIDVSDM